MKLIFEGKVEEGDAYRVDGEGDEGAIRIDGRDVVDEILGAGFTKPVTVAIADKRFQGPITGDFGWGYSEWTPMDPDELNVGEHSLIAILGRYEGQVVRLVVADEAVNFLDGKASSDTNVSESE